MDQKLFRELENMRGREKRSTFIEHLILEGLKTHLNNQKTKQNQPIIPFYENNKRKKDCIG
jgi:metal-responsive CopG/Arc/MetJ family transcriptional regulator